MAKKKAGDDPPADAPRPKPAHEVRAGRIRALIWRNESAEHGAWYSVVISRSYQDGEGRWRSAGSFGRDDLLVVAEVARQAWCWVAQQDGNNTAQPEEETPA